MVRLIQKSGYIKTGSASGYMKYIATRERVEKLEGSGPVTTGQRQLIENLLRDFLDAAELEEYSDYCSATTTGSASSLISAVLDTNAHRLTDRDGYMKYIATRPRVERHGEHGLFSSRPVSLDAALREVEQYTGNVWTFIWSLRREDAARLGYDRAESWRKLIKAHQVEIAEAMKIPPDRLCWYAAFHDEGHHPHVHAMVWSADPTRGRLTKAGVKMIRSKLTNDIFQDVVCCVATRRCKSMAKKRANGEGNIRKRKDGRWEGRYTAGYDPDTGKRIIKNVLGKTQAEVKEKLSQAQQESAGLDVGHSEDYTVATWLRSWYELYAKPNVRPATADRYLLIIETYTVPRIGKIKLRKLTSRDLQKLYKDLMEHGRVQKRSGKGNPGLSSTTVRSVHLTLHCAFERAVKERLIPRNPTDDCIAPKVQKVEMKTLLPEHLKSYLDAADARDVLPMFYLELISGLRKGELVALLWSDLDAEHKTISVSKQYVRNPSGEVMLSRPKTETSVRQVSIPQDAVDLLIQEHGKHPDNQYMFPSPVTGEMYHPDSIVKLHEKILKDAGLEHIRFHDLRHTFATLALQNGVDVKTVSSMLGHYDAGFTLRTYTHATRQMQNQAAETMGNFMAKVM